LQYSIDGFTWHDWDWTLGKEEDFELWKATTEISR
jgi:hypothetical protein